MGESSEGPHAVIRESLPGANDDFTLVFSNAPEPDLRFHWGVASAFGSAGYWIGQHALTFGAQQPPDFSMGSNLIEEIVACLLGGYGIRAEIALAAYRNVRDARLIGQPTLAAEIEAVLRQPVQIDGRSIKYRFAKQRAERIESALRHYYSGDRIPNEPQELRRDLCSIPGIGPKTASWIVRNRFKSASLAVIDIHIQRAGLRAGIFRDEWTLPRDYDLFETAFVQYAAAGRVSVSGLDFVIWDQMRRYSRRAGTFFPQAQHPESQRVRSKLIGELFPPTGRK